MDFIRQEKPFKPSQKMHSLYSIFMFLGLVGLALTLIVDTQRAWSGYLVSLFYFLLLALGGLFFTSVQHITRAGWSVSIRRIPEAFITFLKPGALFCLIFLVLGAIHLYEWLHYDAVQKDALLQHKASYLNLWFFVTRVVVFFALWIILGYKMLNNSLKQDETGDPKLSEKNVPISVIFLLVFALTFSLFSVDIIMSLEPHWFSTIIGVYTFSGMFQSSLAAIILVLFYLLKSNHLKSFVSLDHIHDLGKFLFGFTVFWAYIAFSQFMLIWYANLPEESFYYLHRMSGPWAWVSLSLILFKFVVPFFALLPRWAKRTPRHIISVCVLILVMQYVDVYWMVYPTFYREELTFGLSEITIFLGFLGAFLWAISSFFKKHSLVPIRDPRLSESTQHEVTF